MAISNNTYIKHSKLPKTFKQVFQCTGLFEDIYGGYNGTVDDMISDDIPTTSTEQSVPSVMSHAAAQHDILHSEEIPLTPDVNECEQFYQRTCGCNKDQGNPCSKLFPLQHYIEMRAHCSFLTKGELDLVLMGFISSASLDSEAVKDGRHHNTAKRKRLTMTYKHHGMEICKKTFLFLHGIGKDRLQNVKDHYKVEGIQVRINKNTKCTPHHAMPFFAKRHVLTFLNNYAEENAILLPGRIPGYKRDDIKLLPSSRSKAVRNF